MAEDREEVLREFRPKGSTSRERLEDVPMQPEQAGPPEPDVLIWKPGKKSRSDLDQTTKIDRAELKKRVRRGSASEETVTFRSRQPRPSKPEPFSDGWEPDYEPPAEGYVSEPPVSLHNRVREGELQQKLREGPGKIYDALLKKGIVSLQLGIFFNILIVVLALGAMVLYQMDMVRPERMRLLVMGELFAMMVSALLCWERLGEGLMSLLRLRFTLDSFLLCTFTACVADGIFCYQQVQVPFGGVFCVECLVCLWGQYQRRSTLLAQTDVLHRARRLNRVVRAGDCFDGRPGFHVCEGQVADFMDNLNAPSTPQQVLDGYVLAALAVSGAIALYASSQGGPEAGVRTWAAAILAAAPATVFLSQTRPLAILQRRLRRFGAVCGSWQGIRAARGPAVVPVGDTDLFPGNGLKINGIKVYAGRSSDALLGYATAVLEAAEDCIAPAFTQLLRSRHAQRYEVEHLKRYSDRGYRATVGGQRVLLGRREFLVEKGIRVDPSAQVSHAVYLSVDGVFSAVFAVTPGKRKGVRAGLGALCNHRGLMPVLSSSNFLVTRSFLEEKFGVDAQRIRLPGLAARESLARWKPPCPEAVPCALLTQEGLGGLALSITGGRTLYTASVAGAAVHILAGIIGLGIVLALTLCGRTDLLTPMNLFLLELIWALPGLLISEWTRKP